LESAQAGFAPLQPRFQSLRLKSSGRRLSAGLEWSVYAGLRCQLGNLHIPQAGNTNHHVRGDRMKLSQTTHVRHRTPLLAGLIVGLLAALVFTALAGAAPLAQEPTPTPNPAAAPSAELTPTAPPKACEACHPDVGDAWSASPHAHAYDDPAFSDRWKSLGEPGECLACHTTGYQATSGAFEAEGVTCAGCHGVAEGQHPPAVVPIKADTDYCGSCHPNTHGEWRLTGHSAAGVGCTDCHNPHNQKALFENPDDMCVNCHKDDLGAHKDDFHIEKGIGCVDCHALTLPPEQPPVDGLVPTGHSFTITPATCVACHTDTLQIGRPLPGYEAGAKAVAAGQTEPVTTTLATNAGALPGGSAPVGLTAEQQVQALEAALASTRLSTLFQGGIIGLVLGGTTAYFMAHNAVRRREAEPVIEEAVEAED
jgi:predicted CXXCH cytochrome family protein